MVMMFATFLLLSTFAPMLGLILPELSIVKKEVGPLNLTLHPTLAAPFSYSDRTAH